MTIGRTTEAVAYFVASEALTNVAKHAAPPASR
jgi:signal transduction histidine kinase